MENHNFYDSLEVIWAALSGYRETCIPQGVDPTYDEEWDNICTHMAWIAEELGCPEETEH
jgi:hypothetical protein